MVGLDIGLLEPLHVENAKSWFKWFEVCAGANKWSNVKELFRVATVLEGQAWAAFELLSDVETHMYELKMGDYLQIWQNRVG